MGTERHPGNKLAGSSPVPISTALHSTLSHYRHQPIPSRATRLKAKEDTVTAPLLGLSWSQVMTLDATGHRSAALDRPLN